jgi:small neutral amino acid transporter SnatA (MarC family)
VNILARINGLLIGSISIQMVIESVHELWLAAPSSQG